MARITKQHDSLNAAEGQQDSSTEMNGSNSSSTTAEERDLLWKVGSQFPQTQLRADPFLTSVAPRPTAWICTDQDELALLEGYTIACDSPPSLIFGSKAIPSSMLETLKEKKLCSLSIATVRERHCLPYATFRAKDDVTSGPALTFQKLGLFPVARSNRPPAVDRSPVQMHCKLVELVNLVDDQEMVILEIETVVISGSVLVGPTIETADGRALPTRVSADLIQPMISLGNGKFGTMNHVHKMVRPKAEKRADGSITSWYSVPFQKVISSDQIASDNRRSWTHPQDVEYTYRVEGPKSILGYNPLKAIVIPRAIGWVSTYSEKNRVSHLAPYSFFTEIGRGDCPMVCFSAYRSNWEDDGKKDAQLDSEGTGCFAVNMVTKDLAVRMNYSSAPLKRDESEFELSSLNERRGHLIDAPTVQESQVVLECKHVKTVNIGNFSAVVGQVVGGRLSKSAVTDGLLDPDRLKLIGRMGYVDEYAVVEKKKARTFADFNCAAKVLDERLALEKVDKVRSRVILRAHRRFSL